LVVGPMTLGLATIPPRTTDEARQVVVKTYRVVNYTNSVELTVETTFSGTEAENLRAETAQTGADEIEKSYLNYYAKYHPGIAIARPMEVKDKPEMNALVLTQHYRVSDLWRLSESKEKWTCTVYPQSIRDAVKKPYTLLRTMPLGIAHPSHVIEVDTLILPERISLSNRIESVSDEAMHFKATVIYKEPKVSVTYDYETLTDSLPAAAVPGHLKKLDRLAGELGYSLQLPVCGARAGSPGFQPNWPVMIVSLLYSLILLAGVVFMSLYRPKSLAPPFIDPKLNGLGGWLILMAITLILRALYVIIIIAKNSSSYSLGTWELLTVPGHTYYHPLWAPALLFEMLANLTMLAGSAVSIILFFGKRDTFPRFYLIYLVIQLLAPLIDFALCSPLPIITAATREKAATGILQGVLFAFIWGSYLLKSRRVKATFVK
jgi:hypothetical protein